jgi:hypothetical protein
MTQVPATLSFEEFERLALPVIKPFRSHFGATWFNEAGRKPARRDWLVKDLILARSFGILFGPPGCGKSFLLADLMLNGSAAALEARRVEDKEWFGYRLNGFGVVYLVAEGSDDFVIRLHAWRLNQGLDPETPLPFVFLPTSVDLASSDADTKRLTEEVRGIDLLMREKCGVGVGAVVIDTVSRALAGGNENDSAVMGGFVRNCEAIQKELQVAVVGVHHGGKEVGRGPRGHEALLGAADFTWEVTPRSNEEPTNKWVVRKFKAGAAGASHPFVLKPITVDHDDDADPITSCVVVNREQPLDENGARRERGYPANQSEVEFLRVLSDAIGVHGEMPPQDLKSPSNITLVVDAEKVRALFRERYANTEEGDEEKVLGRLRQRWGRATKSLIRNRVIGSSGHWMWFAGKRVRGVKLRGVEEREPEVAASDDLGKGQQNMEGI